MHASMHNNAETLEIEVVLRECAIKNKSYDPRE